MWLYGSLLLVLASVRLLNKISFDCYRFQTRVINQEAPIWALYGSRTTIANTIISPKVNRSLSQFLFLIWLNKLAVRNI